MSYPYQQPTPAPRKRGRLLIAAVAVALVVALCGVAAVAAIVAGGTEQTADTSTTGQHGTGGTGTAPTATRPAARPAGQITDEGTLLVGTEVKPGTYRATVPADSFGCYWARLKTLDGSLGAILDNGLGEPGTKMTVTIKASDKAFETRGCGPWALV